MSRGTLVLDRRVLRRVVDSEELTAELKEAFSAYTPTASAPARVRAQISPGLISMVLAPGTSPGIPAYTVKVHAKTTGRRRSLTGVIALHDSDTGDLLALMGSAYLTTLRTGIGAAFGTHLLACQNAATVGVIGAGQLGRAQLTHLARLRRMETVHIYDHDHDTARSVATATRAQLGVPARIHTSVESVAETASILLVATWARRPLLALADVIGGAHITSLGADEPGKAELAPDLLDRALVVTDDIGLTTPVLGRADTALTDILQGRHLGRGSEEEITVYSPVGLPMQDCVAAWRAYRRARQAGLGVEIALDTDEDPDVEPEGPGQATPTASPSDMLQDRRNLRDLPAQLAPPSKFEPPGGSSDRRGGRQPADRESEAVVDSRTPDSKQRQWQ